VASCHIWEEECTSAQGLWGAAHARSRKGAFGETTATGQNMLKDANDTTADATPTLTGEQREQLSHYHFPWKAVPCDTSVSQKVFAITARPWALWIPSA